MAVQRLRVALEIGPKGRRVVAIAPDWPGLERGAKTREAAVARLQSYLPRYAAVARLAGMAREFAECSAIDVVEDYAGAGSTDFWGISFACSGIDRAAMTDAELARELRLMRASWRLFDAARGRAPAELEKGPRGGGRDRDRMVSHVLGTEQEWGRKLGLPSTEGARILDDDGVRTFRDAYCAAIRRFHAEGRAARTWPLRYLIRHTAYHTLDHTWEMEDRVPGT